MSRPIDADDLALMAAGFEAAMAGASDSREAEQSIHELGWADLLDAAPARGAAMAFGALGATGSAAGLLDDVVARALGIGVSLQTCVVLPAPHQAGPPARRRNEMGGGLVVNGLVSARAESATAAVVAIADEDGGGFARVDASSLRRPAAGGVDPQNAYRRVSMEVPADAVTPLKTEAAWESAVTAARAALACQLIAGARWMLAQARQHALDRVQFGRPVASVQSIRHKLAESLVQIEGAASVAEACWRDPDLLLAGLAKALAGQAALTAAAHAQQVLAGIGFTAEHRFHLRLKQVLVIDTLFGSARSLPAEIGRDLLIRGTAPRLIQL